MTDSSRLSISIVRSYLTILALLALGASCGGDDGATNSGYCTKAADKLRTCGLLSAGPLECSEDDADRALLLCLQDCISRASCEQLEEAVCDDSNDNPYSLCVGACIPRYTCNDGVKVPSSFKCDGEPDCSGGEDELGCPAFTCQNGQVISESFRCDAEPDCDDMSDENACPAGTTFRCSSGTDIPASYRCDDESDCDDGSDELGCPEYATVICE